MKGKRLKAFKKLMRQYEIQFGFREPFQVLLDSDILQDTAHKIDVISRLKGVLGGEIKPMITQCDMRHLYGAEKKDEELILQAKEYERRRCNHHELEKPLSSEECIASCVGNTNKHRYVIATQSKQLRAAMRQIPGVPLIYINKSVMILEPMATATAELRERDEKAKFKAGLKGRRNTNTPAALGEKRKRDDEEDDEANKSIGAQSTGHSRAQKKNKYVKGPKQPNPLSMKKAKKAPSEDKPKTENTTKPNPAKKDAPEHAAEEAAGAEVSIVEGDGGEAGKRKRKRKHKPKGDGGATGEAEGAEVETGGVAIEA